MKPIKGKTYYIEAFEDENLLYRGPAKCVDDTGAYGGYLFDLSDEKGTAYNDFDIKYEIKDVDLSDNELIIDLKEQIRNLDYRLLKLEERLQYYEN